MVEHSTTKLKARTLIDERQWVDPCLTELLLGCSNMWMRMVRKQLCLSLYMYVRPIPFINWLKLTSNTELLSALITDVNECLDEDTNDCHGNANCTNNVGSYTCTCHDGHAGDGITCTGKNCRKKKKNEEALRNSKVELILPSISRMSSEISSPQCFLQVKGFNCENGLLASSFCVKPLLGDLIYLVYIFFWWNIDGTCNNVCIVESFTR